MSDGDVTTSLVNQVQKATALNVRAEERQWIAPGPPYHGIGIYPVIAALGWLVIFYFLLYFVNFYVVPAIFGRPFFYFGRNYPYPPPYPPMNPYMRSQRLSPGEFHKTNEFNDLTARVTDSLGKAN